jgi:hypothetical protein
MFYHDVPALPVVDFPIPGVPSPNISPPGQAHQSIPQPTQQYYPTISHPSYSLVTTLMCDIGESYIFTPASSHCSSTGQARQTIQQPAEPYYTMSMEPLSAVTMVVALELSFFIILIILKGVPELDDIPGARERTYTHLPAVNMNQYTGYSSHNPSSLHSSQYRITVSDNNFPPSGSLQMYVHYPRLRVAISFTSIQASFTATHTLHRSCALQLLPKIFHS